MSLAEIDQNPVRSIFLPFASVADIKSMEICGDGVVRVDTPRAPTFSIEVRALASPAIAEKWGLWMKMSLAGIYQKPVRIILLPSATSEDIKSMEICGDGIVRVDTPCAPTFSIEPPRASVSCRRSDFPKIFEKRDPQKFLTSERKKFFKIFSTMEFFSLIATHQKSERRSLLESHHPKTFRGPPMRIFASGDPPRQPDPEHPGLGMREKIFLVSKVFKIFGIFYFSKILKSLAHGPKTVRSQSLRFSPSEANRYG
jgi:hypothetical protein